MQMELACSYSIRKDYYRTTEEEKYQSHFQQTEKAFR